MASDNTVLTAVALSSFLKRSIKMSWDDNLFDDQRGAASYFGTHARLLAGPGTGKTLTLSRRAVFLIAENDISPRQIFWTSFSH